MCEQSDLSIVSLQNNSRVFKLLNYVATVSVLINEAYDFFSEF
jgi:hypothetical protein